MKQLFKSGIGLLCVLSLMLSMLCVAPLSASAKSYEGANPTKIQRQWDSKWKSYYIGGRTMYDTACGIFAIVNAVGFATGNTMDPYTVAKWAYSIKAYNYSSGGTTRSLLYPKLQAKYGSTYGFTVDCNGTQGYWAGSSSTRLKNHLQNGGTAIAHVKGHFIAVVDYNPSTNKFRVFDSAPSSSRGSAVTGELGYGDVWLSQSHLATTTKMTIDWYCLITPTGAVINNGVGPTPTNTADKIGTWQVNSKAPATDALNVRDSASTAGNIVGTVQEGDIVYTSELVGSSSNWGKIKNFVSGVEGYASIMNHADYIGIDVLGATPSPAFGDLTTSIDENGRRTITNTSTTDRAGFDMLLPVAIGTDTTPYLSLQITPNYGSGYFFGVTQSGTGYWMMRDCNSSDQLVKEDEAPYMTSTEALEIDLRDWWKPTEDYKIDTVRFYVAPSSSVTVDYCYLAATSGKVKDTTYNLIRQTTPIINENLMLPDTLDITDRSKSGGYVYNNGTLTVTSNSDAGYQVVFNVNKEFAPAKAPNWLFDLVATTGFDIEMEVTTSDGQRCFGLVSDFWPGLCDVLDNDHLPADTYYGTCDIYSCYTWNNCLPANGISTINQVRVQLNGPGTVTLKSLQISNTTDVVNYADGITKSDNSDATVGDVNNDGEVSTLDAREILKHTVSMITLTDSALAAADYNRDGKVDTADAREMLIALIATA